jgi:hypothetical protein
MVAFSPWAKQEELSTNTFVPDANALFVALHACDILMLSTDRFTRGHPQWHIYLSRLYISMLFYFRIMDCMVFSGHADDELITLLNRIKNYIDFRRLTIPGPLVPFFQSLSVCASGNDLLGDITPVLPYLSSATKNYFFSLNQAMTPNVPALLDVLLQVTTATTAFDDNDYSERSHQLWNLHRTDVSDAIDARVAYAVSSCGFGATTHSSPHSNEMLRRAGARLRLPPRINLGATGLQSTPMNWYQFLRFRRLANEPHDIRFSQWFGNVAAVMADYSAYFRDSSTLGSIPLAAGGAPHVLAQYAEQTSTKRVPIQPATLVRKSGSVEAHFDLYEVNSLSVTAEVRIPFLPDVHLQIGTLALTNARRNGFPTEHRTGDAWTQTPVVQKMSNFDTYNNIPTYVSSLHSTRAIE